MTEVIELLSSSPPPARPSNKARTATIVATASRSESFHFDIDEISQSILKDSYTRPAKRPRLSTTTSSNLNSKRTGPATDIVPELNFDLLSDDSLLLSDFQRQKTTIPFEESFRQDKKKPDSKDGIIHSSSAPEVLIAEKQPQKRCGDSSKTVLDNFFDDDLLEDVHLSHSQPVQPEYDSRTANLLASLAQDSESDDRVRPRSIKSRAPQKSVKDSQVDDIEFSSPPRPKISKSSKLTEAEKSSRASERAALRATAKASKAAEQEVEKARKQVQKEQQKRDKQKAADLAEVNKSRTNKKDATSEMILEMSSLLKDTSLANQVEKRMEDVQVEVQYSEEEVDMVNGDLEQEPYGSIITWRRKVKSVYNDECDQWEPISQIRVVKEKHILIHLPAGEFAAVAAVIRSDAGTRVLQTQTEMKANIDAHVSAIRRRNGDCIPVYLLEGLRSWLKKNLNAQNRAYTAAVRAQMVHVDTEAGKNSSQPKPGKRKKRVAESMDLSHVSTDIVDDLLLHLQLAHQPILIHHTSTPADSASQISALTQHLATRPYRHAQLEYNLKSASFCMDSGQVKTGDDLEDTFVKMLQEVQRVTPSMALGIVKEYKTIRKLVKGFDKHGNLLLEDVRKTVNKDGAWSDRRLGPQISKRLFKVFMGRDPTATDGIS